MTTATIRRPAGFRATARAAIVGTLALLAAMAPSSAPAAAAKVAAADNVFTPKEIRVDPGDTVRWDNTGVRVHTVTSDSGLFSSGNMAAGETFEFEFEDEGYYYYHCRHHGSPKSGMWGVVVVGDPPPAGARTKVRVPGDVKTVQGAVDKADPGSTVVVAPGTYRETIVVRTHDLVIRGVDRFRTKLHGSDLEFNGILVDGADDVVIKNLTIRNYLAAGIHLARADSYTINKVDLIKNRTTGVTADSSFDGAVKRSFVWGSGDSGVRIMRCFTCSAIVRKVRASRSYFGVLAWNASGVVVKDSVLKRNGVGVGAITEAAVSTVPAQADTIVGNTISKNNYTKVPAAGISFTYGIPFGTGVWLAGAATTSVEANDVSGHDRYGILVSEAIDGSAPAFRTATKFNDVAGAGVYTLAWDGRGADNCFTGNTIDGPTGPPDIQETYGCPDRPFTGTLFAPVADDVASAIADTSRDQAEPPEPKRPRCQKGTRGCRR